MHERCRKWLARNLPRLCGAATVAVGLLVLTGWWFRAPGLEGQWLGTLVPMSPATALLFVALGGSLIGLSTVTSSWWVVSLGGALAVAGVGAFRLTDYLLDLHTGIDQLLFHDRIAERGLLVTVGMAPTTSLSFLSVGAGMTLIVARARTRQICGQYIVALALFMAAAALIGHLYRALDFYQINGLFPMAASTAISFVLAGCGALSLRRDVGFVGVLTAPNLGGLTARRLFPLIIVAPRCSGFSAFT